MLSLIFLSLAALCNSMMDVIIFNYNKSIFRRRDERRWNPFFSWKYVKLTLGFVRLDGWHIIKYLMLLFISLSVVTYREMFGYWDILVYMFVWGIFFEVGLRIFKK